MACGLEETRRRLTALRAPDGSNASAVEAAIGQAETVARRQIAAVEAPAREAAARAAAANQAVIEGLARQLETLGDARQGFIDQALARLGEGATAAQRAEVERLAGALHDERVAHEAAAEAMRREEQLREEGRRLVEASRTPLEAYAAAQERLNTLLQAGAVDQETYSRALASAAGELAQAQERLLRQSQRWQEGLRRGLLDYAREAGDAARAAEEVTTRAFATMEDALVSFVTTGRVEFRALADGIMADPTRIAVR